MKKNLAKVLGMEELQEVAPPEPSEEQVMQQQLTDVTEHIQQTADATDVAIESIGNALELQRVIQSSNSTDPVTYAVLRKALEQFKERTGVYTEHVALESLSPLNYKTEGIEDIKKFIAKVWEAIKKAFFIMVEKVKAFIKAIFKSNKITEDKLDKAKKANDEFVREAKNVPDSANNNKPYSGDYFKTEKTNFMIF